MKSHLSMSTSHMKIWKSCHQIVWWFFHVLYSIFCCLLFNLFITQKTFRKIKKRLRHQLWIPMQDRCTIYWRVIFKISNVFFIASSKCPQTNETFYFKYFMYILNVPKTGRVFLYWSKTLIFLWFNFWTPFPINTFKGTVFSYDLLSCHTNLFSISILPSIIYFGSK